MAWVRPLSLPVARSLGLPYLLLPEGKFSYSVVLKILTVNLGIPLCYICTLQQQHHIDLHQHSTRDISTAVMVEFGSRAVGVIVSQSVLTLVSSLGLFLRLYARIRVTRNVGLDDVLLVIAWLFSIICTGFIVARKQSTL